MELVTLVAPMLGSVKNGMNKLRRMLKRDAEKNREGEREREREISTLQLERILR